MCVSGTSVEVRVVRTVHSVMLLNRLLLAVSGVLGFCNEPESFLVELESWQSAVTVGQREYTPLI